MGGRERYYLSIMLSSTSHPSQQAIILPSIPMHTQILTPAEGQSRGSEWIDTYGLREQVCRWDWLIQWGAERADNAISCACLVTSQYTHPQQQSHHYHSWSHTRLYYHSSWAWQKQISFRRFDWCISYLISMGAWCVAICILPGLRWCRSYSLDSVWHMLQPGPWQWRRLCWKDRPLSFLQHTTAEIPFQIK